MAKRDFLVTHYDRLLSGEPREQAGLLDSSYQYAPDFQKGSWIYYDRKIILEPLGHLMFAAWEETFMK